MDIFEAAFESIESHMLGIHDDHILSIRDLSSPPHKSCIAAYTNHTQNVYFCAPFILVCDQAHGSENHT